MKLWCAEPKQRNQRQRREQSEPHPWVKRGEQAQAAEPVLASQFLPIVKTP